MLHQTEDSRINSRMSNLMNMAGKLGETTVCQVVRWIRRNAQIFGASVAA